MDFSLSDEEKAIRDTAREFIKRELLPLEQEVLRRERRHEPGITLDEVRELQLKAKKFGFWGLSTPEEYGGMNLPNVTQALIHEEVGRTFVPFRFGGEADNILYYANDEQKAEFLVPTIEGERLSCFAITEPGAGSDAANIKFAARKDGSDWILNGEKTFITGGHDADFVIVVAVTDPEKGARGGGTTAFLVDRAMGWRSEFIQTMGEGGPASLIFEDVRVPERNVLGEIGKGFELGMQWIGRGRYLIPAAALGIAERSLQMAVDYANTRQTFGKPIGANQAIQWMIADSETELEAARWLVYKAAWVVDQGWDHRHSSSMAKLYGANMVNNVVDRVMQIHGGMGYTRELPIERWYRQVRLMRIYEGTDEMQRLIISRDLLRGYTKIGGHLAWRVFESVEDLAKSIGELIGPGSAWPVTQDRVDMFADATGDHQWIHVDRERAATGPFGGTVAHGYLTLSLLPVLVQDLYRVDGVAMAINYGLNKVRFPAPLRVGSAVRATVELVAMEPVAGGYQMTAKVTVTADGADKPCCVAETVSRLYPAP